MKISLEGRTVLITGGSSGIGEACVKLFSEAGADVFFTYNKKAENAAKIAGETHSRAMRCDVSLEQECKKAIDEIISASKRLDILINNAGIYMGACAGSESFPDAWRRVIQVNLYSCAYLAHFAIPFMKKAGKGKIINISSIHSVEGTINSSAYHSSKSGMDGLTRSLAVELAPFNIQVNSIGPGPIDTPIWGNRESGYAKEIEKLIPARRFGKPEEIAYGVLFFASPYADYITGQTLFIDGGMLMNIYKQ